MKTFTVVGCTVTPGIEVNSDPYWRIVLGLGGHKRSTWIPLGKKDAAEMVRKDVEQKDNEIYKIFNVGVIALKDKEQQLTGNHLIVGEKNKNDDRVMVVWSVESGYRGSANIHGGQEVKIIAQDKAWHSGKGNLGETAECLAVLKPGQRLYGEISGRRVEEPRAILEYDGKEIKVTYGKKELETVLSDEQPEGEYV